MSLAVRVGRNLGLFGGTDRGTKVTASSLVAGVWVRSAILVGSGIGAAGSSRLVGIWVCSVGVLLSIDGDEGGSVVTSIWAWEGI